MYFIVNTTKRNVVIPDLKISLGPRQAKDLDIMFKRNEIDSSRHLAAAISRGIINVKVKDGSQVKQEVVTTSQQNNNLNMEELQDRVSDGIAEGLKEAMKIAQPTQPGITPADLQKMLLELQKAQQQVQVQPQVQSGVSSEDIEKIMNKVVDAIKDQQGNTVIMQGEQVKKDEEVEIDEDKLIEIHSRTMDKKMKNTDISDIVYEEKEVDEEGFINNIDELEGLL